MIRRFTPASYHRMLFSSMSVNMLALTLVRFSRGFWFHQCRKIFRHQHQHSLAWSSRSCLAKKLFLRSLQNSLHLQPQLLESFSSVVQSLLSSALSLHSAQLHSLDHWLCYDKKLRTLLTRLEPKLHQKESSEHQIFSSLPLINIRRCKMLEDENNFWEIT